MTDRSRELLDRATYEHAHRFPGYRDILSTVSDEADSTTVDLLELLWNRADSRGNGELQVITNQTLEQQLGLNGITDDKKPFLGAGLFDQIELFSSEKALIIREDLLSWFIRSGFVHTNSSSEIGVSTGFPVVPAKDTLRTDLSFIGASISPSELASNTSSTITDLEKSLREIRMQARLVQNSTTDSNATICEDKFGTISLGDSNNTINVLSWDRRGLHNKSAMGEREDDNREDAPLSNWETDWPITLYKCLTDPDETSPTQKGVGSARLLNQLLEKPALTRRLYETVTNIDDKGCPVTLEDLSLIWDEHGREKTDTPTEILSAAINDLQGNVTGREGDNVRLNRETAVYIVEDIFLKWAPKDVRSLPLKSVRELGEFLENRTDSDGSTPGDATEGDEEMSWVLTGTKFEPLLNVDVDEKSVEETFDEVAEDELRTVVEAIERDRASRNPLGGVDEGYAIIVRVENESIADRRGKQNVTIVNGAIDGQAVFDPPVVRLHPGTTVTWKWTDVGPYSVRHYATNGEPHFDSGTVSEEGYEWEFTFERPGIYPYYSQPDGELGHRGVVIVEGSLYADPDGVDDQLAAARNGPDDLMDFLNDVPNYDGFDNADEVKDEIRKQFGSGPEVDPLLLASVMNVESLRTSQYDDDVWSSFEIAYPDSLKDSFVFAKLHYSGRSQSEGLR